jgi:hypothetical protein
MSLFTALKSFGAWAEKELGKLSTEAPKIEQTADTVLQYAGGAASIIAGLEGGPAASALVSKAVGTIQTGVVALNGLITDFGANPTTVSIATSLATNASALLSAAQIKNPNSVTAANSIITNLSSLAVALNTASGAPPISGPSPATLPVQTA